MSSTFELAFAAARRAYDLTDGLCDPTVLVALEALGYDRDYAAVLEGVPVARVVGPAPGLAGVTLDAENHTVTVAPGVRLDFGASAKALMADLVVEELAVDGGALVEVGGDVAARGTGPEGPWVIGLATNLSLRGDEPRVSIATGGIATSATTTRVWRSRDRIVNHIVDPRTGDCAHGIYCVSTVAGPDCVTANALATAALLWDEEAGRRIVRAGCSARLVREDDSVEFVGGWPAEEVIA